MLTFGGAGSWGRCHTFGILECSPGIPKAFLKFLPLWSFRGLSKPIPGDRSGLSQLWLAEFFDVNVWRCTVLRPVPNVRPPRLLFENTRSLPQSSSIVEILKFEWGYSWEFSEIENFQLVKVPVANFFRRRRLGLVPEVRPCPVPFWDTNILLSSFLVLEILAPSWGQLEGASRASNHYVFSAWSIVKTLLWTLIMGMWPQFRLGVG